MLIDKLGERLAFERTGVRLYEALILKVATATSGLAVDGAQLRRIRDEEEAHFRLVGQCLQEIGADPTAMTPCADVIGVA
ncbi:MAG TPA: ferritin Dps family protein, partial [Ramlibacter sp.]|nr:ferritin Dps family protein [Ramlibacter sp.]